MFANGKLKHSDTWNNKVIIRCSLVDKIISFRELMYVYRYRLKLFMIKSNTFFMMKALS